MYVTLASTNLLLIFQHFNHLPSRKKAPLQKFLTQRGFLYKFWIIAQLLYDFTDPASCRGHWIIHIF